MTFTEEIRLLRHYKKAHPSKPEHYKQKWYWDNPDKNGLGLDGFYLKRYFRASLIILERLTEFFDSKLIINYITIRK